MKKTKYEIQNKNNLTILEISDFLENINIKLILKLLLTNNK